MATVIRFHLPLSFNLFSDPDGLTADICRLICKYKAHVYPIQ